MYVYIYIYISAYIFEKSGGRCSCPDPNRVGQSGFIGENEIIAYDNEDSTVVIMGKSGSTICWRI